MRLRTTTAICLALALQPVMTIAHELDDGHCAPSARPPSTQSCAGESVIGGRTHSVILYSEDGRAASRLTSNNGRFQKSYPILYCYERFFIIKIDEVHYAVNRADVIVDQNIPLACNESETRSFLGGTHASEFENSELSDEPILPWPPPRPSGSLDLRGYAFIRSATNFGEVDDALRSKFKSGGYPSPYYYHAPNGFAVVTKLERLQSNGTPFPDNSRWNTQKIVSVGSFNQYLYALFHPEEGRFREFLVLVTNRPVPTSPDEVTKQDVDKWARSGLSGLPVEDRRVLLQPRTQILLYIYQFEVSAGRTRELVASDQGVDIVGALNSLGINH